MTNTYKPMKYEERILQDGKLTKEGFEDAKRRFIDFIDYFGERYNPPEHVWFSLALAADAIMRSEKALFPEPKI